MTKQIELGNIAKHKITGFTGVVIGSTEYLFNQRQLTISPREMKDGKPLSNMSFDSSGLEFVEESDHEIIPVQRPKVPVGLGDLVKDRISGVEGIATSWTTWSAGCSRIGVQPKALKDGMPVDASVFDEKDLILVEAASPKHKPVKTGGPRPEPSILR